jgi:hypothetical protein
VNILSAFNEDIRPRLPQTARIRVPLDEIPGQRVFVYEHLKDDFLGMVKDQIAVRARKEVLKAALQGTAELHDRDIVHLGKPNDQVYW